MPVLARRAAREYKSIIRWLPNEILAEITSYSSNSDLVALCTTSRLFYAMAMRVLYHTVTLWNSAQLDGFLWTMAAHDHPIAALLTARLPDLVRRFAIEDKHGMLWRQDITFQAEALAALLSKLPHLKSVELCACTPDKLTDTLLERGSFKKLSQFTYTARWQISSPLVSFLNRHSTITHLTLYHHGALQPSAAGAIHLPNLRSYRGDCFFEATAMPSVTYVYLDRPGDLDIEPTLKQLGALAALRQLVILFHGLTAAGIVDCVARNVPQVEILISVGRVNTPMSPEETLEIAASLEKFEGLSHLHLAGEVNDRDHDEDLSTVTMWGGACKTLSSIGLHYAFWQKSKGNWVEIPLSRDVRRYR
ncbi:hypothetical protein MSAN_00955500 [Mycena sanguinolenta]|uniref:F-box domain-containing protein n=1 Tax=Mycena sanguinolenta TaxID=230812 RepID=A0A8H6YV61_9AGAR|nr:hypothetical protein MSAN_00955500 [Mycena sanguinolenta]